MAPVCNTGVHPPSGVPAPFASASRFDWYRATVPAHPSLIIDACIGLADGGVVLVDEGPGRFNYLRSTTISQGGDRVATILHGGSNGHPNVEASGERAPALAELLQSKGGHRLTRCDVARDMLVEPDSGLSQLEPVLLSIAAQHGLSVRKVGNPIDPSAGETIYLGSRQSAVFARVYEKGKADGAAYGDVETSVLQRWVRCELEVKPQKEMKVRASMMAPDEFWGVSAWTSLLAAEVFAMAPDPIPFHPRRTASDDRAFSTMCGQYRNLLRRRCEAKHGGDRLALAREIIASIFDETGEQAA